MAGTLYLCATPIGNLEDMTFRAVRILKEADLIAAEDTRNSMRLLNHFDIHTPMTSYHANNRIEKARVLVDRLLEGKSVVLITDAGTPGISDPGEDLVRMAAEAGITVTPVPGACACISGLITSGLPTRRFCFEAFLPREKKELQKVLEELKTETRTIVIYEAPHRLVRTLETLEKALGDRRVTLCRELTKKHETILRTTLREALRYYSGEEPRGEFVIVIEGRSGEDLLREQQQRWEEMTLPQHMDLYLQQGLDRREAMKMVARDRGIGKRDVYSLLLEEEEGKDGENGG